MTKHIGQLLQVQGGVRVIPSCPGDLRVRGNTNLDPTGSDAVGIDPVDQLTAVAWTRSHRLWSAQDRASVESVIFANAACNPVGLLFASSAARTFGNPIQWVLAILDNAVLG